MPLTKKLYAQLNMTSNAKPICIYRRAHVCETPNEHFLVPSFRRSPRPGNDVHPDLEHFRRDADSDFM